MKKLVIGGLILLVLGALATGLFVWSLDARAHAGGVASGDVDLEVQKGSTARSVAVLLTKAGLVDDMQSFRYAVWRRGGLKLKAGHFRLSKSLNAFGLADALEQSPLAEDEPFAVVEGWRLRDADEALAAAGRADPGAYLEAIITPSTESTSILTSAAMVGQRKTRAMATWAEARGFTTILNERRFDDSFTRTESEPAIALCGLDNGLGRRALDRVGFKMVVEAGLGSGHRDFRTMRLHTLPGRRAAAELWKSTPAVENVANQPAYEHLLTNGNLDQCGVTLLAGKAVGAPFVGATAACLAISEILRLLHDGPSTASIDLDLASIEHRTVIARDAGFDKFNPGFIT